MADIIVKAMTYADSDPETSLIHARKSAEAICTRIFATEIGDPTGTRLDKLIDLLVKQDKLPERIKLPMGVIQRYGNYAAHFQADLETVDRDYIDPCLTALVHVTNWFFLDYLGIGIPSAIAKANNEYEPSAQEEAPPTLELAEVKERLELPAPLREYQWEGISFLFRRDAAMLADEMGLGKTVQTIVALRLLMEGTVSKRALIVVPASLARNWEAELATWAPSLGVRRVSGTVADRQATYQLPIQILIATYDQIRNDGIDIAHDVEFDVVVLDEAQRIKNRHSKAALACRLLRRKKAWVLTGTPLENSLDDLVSIFLFLNSRLIDVGMSPRDIHARIRAHFLRRRKADVLEELPPIISQELPIALSGVQEREYTNIWVSRRQRCRQDGLPATETALLALITKLKQLCNYEPRSGRSAKWDALSLILEDLSGPDDKIIVFSQYVETLRFLEERMGAFPCGLYTGQQTQDKREQELSTFRNATGPRALLVSLKAGGVGLNIQEASTVVLFDRWWNPAVENQAIHRAHRFGRSRPLHVLYFKTIDTIEERISKILQSKRDQFDAYVEGAHNAPVSQFTRDELRGILRLSSADIDQDFTLTENYN